MIMRRNLPATVLAMAVAGCGNGATVAEDTSPRPVTTVGQASDPAPASDPSDAVREYMAAIASNDPDEMRDALPLTVDGSAAHAYMVFHAVRAEALLDGGFPILDYAFDMTSAGDGYELCLDGECTVFDSFKEDQGLLRACLRSGWFGGVAA